MSENGFHVHGAHEHAVEHAAHHGPSLAQSVAIFTAILSTLGAIVSYQGGATQNEALLYKNEAILKKSQASDQWNYYQAKSTKGHLMELARDLAPPGKKAEYESLIQKYAQEKAEIKQQADKLESASHAADEQSDSALRPHHKLAQAITFLQIAISLASITVLTRARWLFVLAGLSAAAGTGLWVLAWIG